MLRATSEFPNYVHLKCSRSLGFLKTTRMSPWLAGFPGIPPAASTSLGIPIPEAQDPKLKYSIQRSEARDPDLKIQS